MASIAPPEKKRRFAVDDRIRQQIRKHHRSHPTLSQTGIAEWATANFGRKIAQSTVAQSP